MKRVLIFAAVAAVACTALVLTIQLQSKRAAAGVTVDDPLQVSKYLGDTPITFVPVDDLSEARVTNADALAAVNNSPYAAVDVTQYSHHEYLGRVTNPSYFASDGSGLVLNNRLVWAVYVEGLSFATQRSSQEDRRFNRRHSRPRAVSHCPNLLGRRFDRRGLGISHLSVLFRPRKAGLPPGIAGRCTSTLRDEASGIGDSSDRTNQRRPTTVGRVEPVLFTTLKDGRTPKGRGSG